MDINSREFSKDMKTRKRKVKIPPRTYKIMQVNEYVIFISVFNIILLIISIQQQHNKMLQSAVTLAPPPNIFIDSFKRPGGFSAIM